MNSIDISSPPSANRLAEIEALLADTGMSPRHFGILHFNNPSYVPIIRGGLQPRPRTLARIDEAIAAHRRILAGGKLSAADAALRARVRRAPRRLNQEEIAAERSAFLARLHALRERCGLTREEFGRLHFSDGRFLERLACGTSRLGGPTRRYMETMLAGGSNPEARSDARPHIERLEAARKALGLTVSALGREHFGHPSFLWLVRKRAGLQGKTVARIEAFIAKLERGDFDHMRPEGRP